MIIPSCDDVAALMIDSARYDDLMIYESYYDSKWFMARLMIARDSLHKAKKKIQVIITRIRNVIKRTTPSMKCKCTILFIVNVSFLFSGTEKKIIRRAYIYLSNIEINKYVRQMLENEFCVVK